MLADMHFKGAWRDYQARVLSEMDDHLADGRLHIVAAPGSGKTILGLEAMRRIGRPALILSPSITVRDQWRARLFPLFLDDPHGWDGYISNDIEAPATMTIVTYQALHAVHADDAVRFDALVAALNDKAPLTLIVDEAHHLRREWWVALFELRSRLKDTCLVALTATPPYDAPFAEWTRYESLCGPIDSEISVPELVRSNDLCSHQDHVFLSTPSSEECDLLVRRRVDIEALVARMTGDAALLDSMAAHPWLTDPETHEEELLEQPEYVTALLIALHMGGRAMPVAVTRMLGVAGAELPALTAQWIERLLDGLINEPRSRDTIGDQQWRELRRVLDGLGVIENKRVTLMESKAIFAAMAGSVAKLDSIVAIARAEAASLGDGLRLVILSDRVRADELPRHIDAGFAPSKLGVVPIFEALRRAGVKDGALAVLTGTLVILPDTIGGALDREAVAMRIEPALLKRRPLPGCPGYEVVEATGAAGQRIVALVTRLFETGAIHVLIGTQALLGEGWDAPAINSLILASNAGSYMLSNQMRGRAIRVDPGVPGKVANIWHLATIVPGSADAATSGDMLQLERRFEAFEGIANGPNDMIENGMGRLALGPMIAPDLTNVTTLERAGDRAMTAAKWRSSLGDGTARSHVRHVAEAGYAPQRLAWRDTLQALIMSGVSGGALSAVGALRRFGNVGSIATFLMIFLGATFLYSLPKLGRAGLLYWRNGTLERSLAQVSGAIIASLRHAGALTRDEAAYQIIVKPSVSGRYDVIIDGASRAEERIFLDALAELLGPVQNPRYLLARRSRLWRVRRVDYHAVPAMLAAHKDSAEQFHREWTRRVGSSELIYTRTGDGRRVLLRARVQSFAAGMQRFFQRRSVWM